MCVSVEKDMEGVGEDRAPGPCPAHVASLPGSASSWLMSPAHEGDPAP